MPILDAYGRKMPPSPSPRQRALRALKARYDGAATNSDNARHWANADLMSADAANSPEVRAKLRSRCRYECYESNSFCNGIVKTLANYLIGPGARLKMQTGQRVRDRQIQTAWRRWARRVKFARKLRTLRMAKAVDGEGVMLLTNNPRLPGPVKLDLQLREADQMATPQLLWPEKGKIDGVELDTYDNPIRYSFLKDHPGATHLTGNPLENEWIDARHVIHWYRHDRPGQHRGIPELAPALPLFALVRRYVLAVLAAAETAADFAGVMYTDSNAVDVDTDVDPMDAIELEMRAMLTLPAGWKLGQMKAEQPVTTFEEFRNAIWNEAARCVLMPFNIAAGNSAGYNFASGRLDHQAFDLAIDTDRCDCEDEVLERVFEAWLREYLSEMSGIAASDIDLSLYDQHSWYWPPKEHVDPQKQANATKTLWDLALISDDDYLFERGVDPDEHEEALSRQMARRRRLGLPLPGGASAGSDDEPEDDELDDDEKEAAVESHRAGAAAAGEMLHV
ncbi:MAG: phage portal protein [Planctomycetota bacterium]